MVATSNPNNIPVKATQASLSAMSPRALVLLVLLAGCQATQPSAPPTPKPELEPVSIEIRTYPAGGLVIWNGDALGPEPVTLKLQPRPGNRWPITGHMFQSFEARWPDGRWAYESYPSNSTMPGRVFLMPH